MPQLGAAAQVEPTWEEATEFVPADWNTELSLAPAAGLPPPDKLGEDVFLALTNLMDSEICFPPDYGLRIYRRDSAGSTMEEIPDRVIYMSDKNVVLSGSSVPPFYGRGLVDLRVNRDEGCNPCAVRVVVEGKRTDCEHGQPVRAYADLTLFAPEADSGGAVSTPWP